MLNYHTRKYSLIAVPNLLHVVKLSWPVLWK